MSYNATFGRQHTEMFARDIKEGDSAIVDADSDGNVIVLNCSSGAPDSLPLPCNMAAFEFPPIVYFFLSKYSCS
jgi:hypothetical protein